MLRVKEFLISPRKDNRAEKFGIEGVKVRKNEKRYDVKGYRNPGEGEEIKEIIRRQLNLIWQDHSPIDFVPSSASKLW